MNSRQHSNPSNPLRRCSTASWSSVSKWRPRPRVASSCRNRASRNWTRQGFWPSVLVDWTRMAREFRVVLRQVIRFWFRRWVVVAFVIFFGLGMESEDVNGCCDLEFELHPRERLADVCTVWWITSQGRRWGVPPFQRPWVSRQKKKPLSPFIRAHANETAVSWQRSTSKRATIITRTRIMYYTCIKSKHSEQWARGLMLKLYRRTWLGEWMRLACAF